MGNVATHLDNDPELQGEVIMSVYFSGTDGHIIHGWTQISLFASLTAAFDVSDPSVRVPDNDFPLKMGFDGCGITNGMMGTIFAYGLQEQCNLVAARVQQLVFEKHKKSPIKLFGIISWRNGYHYAHQNVGSL